MRRRPSPLLAAAVAAAVAILLPVGASAHLNCTHPPKPSPAVPLVSIDLTGETVAPASSNVSVSPFDFGSEISLTISDASAPRVYELSIPLSSDERLTLLSGGGAAVTAPLPTYPDFGFGDYSGLQSNDQSLSTDSNTSDGTPELPPADEDDAAAVPDDDEDATVDTGNEDITTTLDGETIVDDALDEAGDVVVVAALAPPTATNATGESVPVSLGKSNGALIVSVTPPESATFPVQLTIPVGFNTDYQASSVTDQGTTGNSIVRAHGRSAFTSSTRRSRLTQARVSCSGDGAQIVISASSGSTSLDTAIMNNPASCATYYISVAPIKSAKSVDPRPKSAAAILAQNSNKRMKQARARFVPVAEISYGAIADAHLSFPYTARRFASKMKRLGYGMWSIDEAPCDLLNGPSDPSWSRFTDLVKGLSPNGRTKGIIFNCYHRHGDNLQNIRKYKTSLKGLLSQQTGKTNFDWQTLSSTTSLWAEENYTLCSLVCNGGKLKDMAKYTNAYMQHSARLAFAWDVPDGLTQAQSFLQTSFSNLTNGWAPVPVLYYPKWPPGAKPIPQNYGDSAYGTYDLSLTQVKRLSRLQIYSARLWGNGQHPYSGPRIGIRWTDRLDLRKASDGKPRWGAGKRDALAVGIANALAGAYGQGGSASQACDPRGILTAKCRPNTGGTFTKNWSIFRYWSKPKATCRPSNDNFANNDPPLADPTGSVGGTLNCATLEPSETAPGGATKSVWYRWTAPQDENFMGFEFYADAGPQTTVYKGDSLGNLSEVPSRGCSGLTVIAGTTYWIQVVNTGVEAVPSGAFTLRWGRYICEL
jgi:hypothetical protein